MVVAEELALIRDLALVLVAAGVVALLFHRIKLPTVLGYLVAGVLVGPNVAPVPLVQDPENIQLLAELGVLFLLFSLGLHFHLGKLRRVGGLAFTAGALEVSLMIGAGILAASLFGWRPLDALFLGAILAISSTTMIVKVQSDLGRLNSPSTEAIFGILLVEDLVAVLLIALLSSIALTGTVSAAAIGALVLRIAIFVVATLVIGLVVVPRVVDYVARTRVEELLVLVVVGVAFLISMVAVSLELSLALGAFIAGAVVAESRASATVERKIGPLRDVFTAVFFVSMGILLDPADVLANWRPILAFSAMAIVGNILAGSLATFVAGFPPREAVQVGVGMAMIGEFSFVIAQIGQGLGVTAPFLFPVAVSVSAVTALVTPFLVRRGDKVADVLARATPPGVRSYLSMYSAWVNRVRPRGAEAYSGGYDYASLARALAYAAILVSLGFAVQNFGDTLLLLLGGTLYAAVAFYAAVILLAAPVVVGLWRAVRALVDHLVHVVVPPGQARTRRGAAAAAVLRHSLYVFLALVLGLVAIAAGSTFLPPLPLMLGAAGLVVVAGFLLRGSLRRLDHQLEEAVQAVFGGEASAASRDQVLHIIRERYPWDLHVESVLIPPGSRSANRRIRDIALPQRTGATIVTHERGGVQTVNPPPDVILLPGDGVSVLGEREQVEEARALLTSEPALVERPTATAQEGVEIEEVDVEEGAPVSGLTLAGSRIRETTGASVVGVRREGVPILNPAPVMRLRPGDSVVLLGSPAQLAAAKRLFRRPGAG